MAGVTRQTATGAGSKSAKRSPTPSVEVRESAVGFGVFAVAKLRKGAVIDEVTGTILDDPDYVSDYCIDLGGDYSLEPGAPFRYLNHSCDPNAELAMYESDGEASDPPSMWLYAIRGIRPGEELTIDYGWPAYAAIACLCGSPKCRGWIVDPAELELLQRTSPQKPKRSKR